VTRNGDDSLHSDHPEGWGDSTVEEATANLREAVELFLECANPEAVKRRLRTEVFVTRIEARHG